MVFVKVRETYDLHTSKDKMSIIGVHTPMADIIKKSYPGLLMQCKAYRPVSCDVKIACASMMPLDPLGVGTTDGDIAPEDVFNPILYKAMSNFGMSQIDHYINGQMFGSSFGGSTMRAEIDGVMADDNPGGYDDFSLYYGLLAQTHEWKHANPQSGMSMTGLKPLVYEVLNTAGQNMASLGINQINNVGTDDGYQSTGTATPGAIQTYNFRGSAKPMPMLNTTAYDTQVMNTPQTGFYTSSAGDNVVLNKQVGVPAPKVYVGCIIIPPSRLHQLFYRMVVEWTLEFSQVRSIQDITTWRSLCAYGDSTYARSYDYEASSLSSKTTMVDTTTDIEKVM